MSNKGAKGEIMNRLEGMEVRDRKQLGEIVGFQGRAKDVRSWDSRKWVWCVCKNENYFLQY